MRWTLRINVSGWLNVDGLGIFAALAIAAVAAVNEVRDEDDFEDDDDNDDGDYDSEVRGIVIVVGHRCGRVGVNFRRSSEVDGGFCLGM